jgi:alkylated DNA repair protein (DNA oxidative demethylase)
MARTRTRTRAALGDLLDAVPRTPDELAIADGAVLLRGFAAAEAPLLVDTIAAVTAQAPFRHMMTPGGFRMSVAMTNCGAAGWITDRRGYRYDPRDPETQHAWPALPRGFVEIADRAAAAAGYDAFVPDACLINRYEAGSKLSLHQDRNERDYAAPIVSVSLGLPALFLFGGAKRNDRATRIPLASGDVVVWGGLARLFFHGVDTLADGEHPLTGGYRFNLTLRKAL